MVVVKSFFASLMGQRVAVALLLIGLTLGIAAIAIAVVGVAFGTPPIAPTRWMSTLIG